MGLVRKNRGWLVLLLLGGMGFLPGIALATQADLGTQDTLVLDCRGFRANRDLCGQLQARLRTRAGSESIDQRLVCARHWLRQATTNGLARGRVRSYSPARLRSFTPSQHLDAGIAQLVAGRIGEGMFHLLRAYELQPSLASAGDATYIGLLLYWDQLESEQQVDWAADVASRLTRTWRLPTKNPAPQKVPVPRAIDIARAIHLAELAEDHKAVGQFIRFGQIFYPQMATWNAITVREIPAHQTSARQEASRSSHRWDRN